MVIDIYIQSQIPMEILYVNASHTNGSAHTQEGLQLSFFWFFQDFAQVGGGGVRNNFR